MQYDILSLMNGSRRGVAPAAQRIGLAFLSAAYGLATRARNYAYDAGWKSSVRVEVPVISIGNLTAGGTGKTPCVEYVARFAHNLQIRATLLSRGYGSEKGRNDEALVLEENLPFVPHLQGADRATLARTAIDDLKSELLILDDGFQHRRLARDLDVVLIDATCPWGFGHLLPRGLLRESPRALRRADLAILTRCDLVEAVDLTRTRSEIATWAPALPVVQSVFRPDRWLNASRETPKIDRFKGLPVAGFCGIGNPEGFRRTLLKLGMKVVAWRTFPDHHHYDLADVESLGRWASMLPPGAIFATTQKDLVKIRLDQIGGKALWALRIDMKIDNPEYLNACLSKVIGRRQAA